MKFNPPTALAAKGDWAQRYPFKKKKSYVYLGEIPNMPGHCVVACQKNGTIHAGYHTELFTELSSDEI